MNTPASGKYKAAAATAAPLRVDLDRAWGGQARIHFGQAVAETGNSRARRGAPLLVALLTLAVLVSALGVVYAKHQSRKLFIELQNVQAVQDEMNVEWGQLQLEQSTLATHAMIDSVARTKLEMLAPAPEDIVIVRP